MDPPLGGFGVIVTTVMIFPSNNKCYIIRRKSSEIYHIYLCYCSLGNMILKEKMLVEHRSSNWKVAGSKGLIINIPLTSTAFQ
jgi:hypothetical protein